MPGWRRIRSRKRTEGRQDQHLALRRRQGWLSPFRWRDGSRREWGLRELVVERDCVQLSLFGTAAV